jgi:hypothetical protein
MMYASSHLASWGALHRMNSRFSLRHIPYKEIYMLVDKLRGVEFLAVECEALESWEECEGFQIWGYWPDVGGSLDDMVRSMHGNGRNMFCG